MPKKRVIKKKPFLERMMDIPSRIAFEIALFPNNVPLPSPRTSACLIGGSMHFVHLLVRVNQIRKVPDSDLGWEDMYHEGEGNPWFDWTLPFTLLLFLLAIFNAIRLFTRIKLYRLHHATDPVSSPSAKFVSAEFDFEPLQPPPLFNRVLSAIWQSLISSIRFLLNMAPAKKPIAPGKFARVQQLDMWTPGEIEMGLFTIYSPAHALLWLGTNTSNWIVMLLIMGVVGVQLHALTRSYTLLLKDKEIISAEVMKEYNQGFVYPRIMPIRKDVAVMTHQSEVVNVWED